MNTLPPELAERLRKLDPQLCARVESVLATSPASASGDKVLTAAEAAELANLQAQMKSADTTAADRGLLAVKCLKLRGLDGLFPKQSSMSASGAR